MHYARRGTDVEPDTDLLRRVNDQLLDFVEELNHLLEAGAVCVVEGKRDIRALQHAGVKMKSTQVVTISGRRVHEVLDELERRKTPGLVLLTDLDREGRSIAARIRDDAARRRIKILDRPRRKLRSLEQRVFAIEDIFGLCRRLEAQGLR